ncbi:MAG: hypothetical protein AAGD22_17940 [Verrucomicrobiota bacterium]
MAWQSSRVGDGVEKSALGVSGEAAVDGEMGVDVFPMDVARGFLEAENLEERLRWTRLPDLVGELIGGGEVAAELGAYPIGFRGLRFMTRARAGSMEYHLFHVIMEEDGGSRLIAVVETSEGRRVDWETFVRYQPVGWDEILSQGTGGEVVPVRAFVSASDYYNYEYADGEKWSCYEIISPDIEGRLFGYAARDSEFDESLRHYLEARRGADGRALQQRVILKIRGEEEGVGRVNRQVEIADLEQYGWVRDGDDIEPVPDWRVAGDEEELFGGEVEVDE